MVVCEIKINLKKLDKWLSKVYLMEYRSGSSRKKNPNKPKVHKKLIKFVSMQTTMTIQHP